MVAVESKLWSYHVGSAAVVLLSITSCSSQQCTQGKCPQGNADAYSSQRETLPEATIRWHRGRGSTRCGLPLEWTTVLVPPTVMPSLVVDQRFVTERVVLSGSLIDQPATSRAWGTQPVGEYLEDRLPDNQTSIGICPTNFGWQERAYVWSQGELLGLRGDRPTQLLWMLTWNLSGWSSIRDDAEGIRRKLQTEPNAVALETVALVEQGQAVPLETILEHPRALADLRNIFDFAHGAGLQLPSRFWQLLRKVMPSTYAQAQALIKGKNLEISLHPQLNLEEIAELRSLVSHAHLGDKLQVEDDLLRYKGSWPMQRLPLFGLGCREDGWLVIVAVDGRQKLLPGATVEELGRLMIHYGVTEAGLGSAGGDVAIVFKHAANITLINTPSNRDNASGKPTTRRVPSSLYFTSHHQHLWIKEDEQVFKNHV